MSDPPEGGTMSTEEDIAAEAEREAFLDDWQKGLGRQIRRRREEIGLTQQDVGELARVHRATIRAVEAGRSVEDKTLGNVLRALACSPWVDPFDKEQSEIQPVLSATLTKWIIDGVFNLEEQLQLRKYPPVDHAELDRDFENMVDRDFMIDSYLALVLALADAIGGIPSGFGEFRANLAMTKPQLRMLDHELHQAFGKLYPYPPPPPPPERTLVVLKDGTAVRGDELDPALADKVVRVERTVESVEPGQSDARDASRGKTRKALDAIVGAEATKHPQPRITLVTGSPRSSLEVDVSMPPRADRRIPIAAARDLADSLDMLQEADLPGSVLHGLTEYLLGRAGEPGARLVDEAAAQIKALSALDLFPSPPLEDDHGDNDDNQ